MFWLLPLLWIVGGSLAAIMSELVRAESPALVALGRWLLALALASELLGSAVAFAVADSNPEAAYHGSHTRWWAYALGGGVPLTVVTSILARRGFTNARARLLLVAATLAAAALYLAFPYGYAPPGARLHGLALWEHRHHLLDALVLVTPSALLLLVEVTRGLAATGQRRLARG